MEERHPEDITREDIIKALKVYVPAPTRKKELPKVTPTKKMKITENVPLMIGLGLIGAMLLFGKKGD